MSCTSSLASSCVPSVVSMRYNFFVVQFPLCPGCDPVVESVKTINVLVNGVANVSNLAPALYDSVNRVVIYHVVLNTSTSVNKLSRTVEIRRNNHMDTQITHSFSVLFDTVLPNGTYSLASPGAINGVTFYGSTIRIGVRDTNSPLTNGKIELRKGDIVLDSVEGLVAAQNTYVYHNFFITPDILEPGTHSLSYRVYDDLGNYNTIALAIPIIVMAEDKRSKPKVTVYPNLDGSIQNGSRENVKFVYEDRIPAKSSDLGTVDLRRCDTGLSIQSAFSNAGWSLGSHGLPSRLMRSGLVCHHTGSPTNIPSGPVNAETAIVNPKLTEGSLLKSDNTIVVDPSKVSSIGINSLIFKDGGGVIRQYATSLTGNYIEVNFTNAPNEGTVNMYAIDRLGQKVPIGSSTGSWVVLSSTSRRINLTFTSLPYGYFFIQFHFTNGGIYYHGPLVLGTSSVSSLYIPSSAAIVFSANPLLPGDTITYQITPSNSAHWRWVTARMELKDQNNVWQVIDEWQMQEVNPVTGRIDIVHQVTIDDLAYGAISNVSSNIRFRYFLLSDINLTTRYTSSYTTSTRNIKTPYTTPQERELFLSENCGTGSDGVLTVGAGTTLTLHGEKNYTDVDIYGTVKITPYDPAIPGSGKLHIKCTGGFILQSIGTIDARGVGLPGGIAKIAGTANPNDHIHMNYAGQGAGRGFAGNDYSSYPAGGGGGAGYVFEGVSGSAGNIVGRRLGSKGGKFYYQDYPTQEFFEMGSGGGAGGFSVDTISTGASGIGGKGGGAVKISATGIVFIVGKILCDGAPGGDVMVLGYDTSGGNNKRVDIPYAFEDISTTGILRPLTDDSVIQVALPWEWDIDGVSYNKIWVSSNGYLDFNATNAASNSSLLAMTRRNIICPFWDDLCPYGGGSNTMNVYTEIKTAPNGKQYFVIQWHEVHHYATRNTAGAHITFQVKLFHDKTFEFHYKDVMFGNAFYDKGKSATVGAIFMNSADPTKEVWQINYNSDALLTDLYAVRPDFQYAKHGGGGAGSGGFIQILSKQEIMLHSTLHKFSVKGARGGFGQLGGNGGASSDGILRLAANTMQYEPIVEGVYQRFGTRQV